MDDATLVKMRADFERVAESRLRCGAWSAADVRELGEVIKRAVDKGDQDLMQGWAQWLADLSADIDAKRLEQARAAWEAERALEVAYRHDEAAIREMNRAWVASRSMRIAAGGDK